MAVRVGILRVLAFGGLATAAAAAIAGCKDGELPEDTDPIPTDGGDDACGDNPPSIEELTIEAGEMVAEGDDTCGGEATPTIVISALTHDDDSDLNYWAMRVWFDDEVDGSVATTGPYIEVTSTAADDCTVDDITARMRLCVSGTIPREAHLEWAVKMLDAEDNESGVVIAEFTTPDAQGNYPEDTDTP